MKNETVLNVMKKEAQSLIGHISSYQQSKDKIAKQIDIVASLKTINELSKELDKNE